MSEHSTLKLSLALAVFSVSSFAQSFQAQITGVVKDQSDAIVPAAQLTAKNVATGVLYSAVSNDVGLYRFPNLPPAQYTLSCTHPGFKRFEQGPVTLQVNQVLEVNVLLTPGATSEE